VRKEKMNTFWTLLKESVIVQSLVTFGLVTTCCILWGTSSVVPDRLIDLTFAVVGYWFGTKATYMNMTKPAAGASHEER